MKKSLIAFMAAAAVIFASGCGSLKVDSNTIVIDRNGKITEGIAEDFSADYYSADELKAYIEKAVDTFETEYGKGIVKTSGFRADEKKAYMTVKYENQEAYENFTGNEIFAGTISEAEKEGYDFDVDFLKVKDGKTQKEAEKDEVLSDGSLNVLILHEITDIKVPGTIRYISSAGLEVTGEKTVAMKQGNDTAVAPPVYVIYE